MIFKAGGADHLKGEKIDSPKGPSIVTATDGSSEDATSKRSERRSSETGSLV